VNTRARLAAALAAALALAACSKSEGMPPDAGEGGAPMSMMSSCQQIRLCVLGTPCADATCVANCAAQGTADGKSAFEALRACTANTCAVGDVNCACGEQCQLGGSCLHEADVCLGTSSSDSICDSVCA
jgi:hypothetical protein